MLSKLHVALETALSRGHAPAAPRTGPRAATYDLNLASSPDRGAVALLLPCGNQSTAPVIASSWTSRFFRTPAAGRRPRAPSNLTNPRPGWSSNAASGRLLATTYGHLCAALHAPVFDAGRMQLRERWRRMRSLRWVFVWDVRARNPHGCMPSCMVLARHLDHRPSV